MTPLGREGHGLQELDGVVHLLHQGSLQLQNRIPADIQARIAQLKAQIESRLDSAAGAGSQNALDAEAIDITLPGTHRALHVLSPLGRRFRSGPVDVHYGPPRGILVAGPRSRCGDTAVAAP